MTTDLASAALDLARVFSRGGRLVVIAPTRHDHAEHVAVEFIHPAVVGARSLPAVAVRQLDVVSSLTVGDALVVITPPAPFDGDLVADVPGAGLVITTDASASEPELVRWYHVLWELVQVGLEHPGLTGGAAVSGGDSTNFLYPFLDATESNEQELLASMRLSASAKADESLDVSRAAAAANADQLAQVAAAVTACHDRDGTVYAIGNGGSSCDAGRLTRLLRTLGIRATSLAADPAVLTALANDLGVNQVFARQVEANVQSGDMLFVFSTSGASSNLLAALDVDVIREVTTVTSAGYGGGALAAHPACNHCLTVDSTSVHRIQEAQGVLVDELCSRVAATVQLSA